MNKCINCKSELKEVELVCSECREPLCDSCHSNYGGMCAACSEEYED